MIEKRYSRVEQVRQGAYSPLFAYMVEREKQKVEKEAHM